jgi:hypothetical protein
MDFQIGRIYRENDLVLTVSAVFEATHRRISSKLLSLAIRG